MKLRHRRGNDINSEILGWMFVGLKITGIYVDENEAICYMKPFQP